MKKEIVKITCIAKDDMLVGTYRRRNFKKGEKYRGTYYPATGAVLIEVPVGTHGGTKIHFGIKKLKELFLVLQ